MAVRLRPLTQQNEDNSVQQQLVKQMKTIQIMSDAEDDMQLDLQRTVSMD